MFKSTTVKAALAGALALTLVGAGVSAANAAITPAGSTSEFYIHDATTEALVADGAPIATKVMNISTAFDHRIVDGHDAASFVAQVKEMLEKPELLLLG